MDPVNGAFNGIAGLMVGWLAPVLTVVLIWLGYQYMFAGDDHTNATRAKKAIAVAIVSAILIATAVLLGPTIVRTITPGGGK